jgi:hypothetical protein
MTHDECLNDENEERLVPRHSSFVLRHSFRHSSLEISHSPVDCGFSRRRAINAGIPFAIPSAIPNRSFSETNVRGRNKEEAILCVGAGE